MSDLANEVRVLSERLHHVVGGDSEIGRALASLNERVGRIEREMAFIEYVLEEARPGRLKMAKLSVDGESN